MDLSKIPDDMPIDCIHPNKLQEITTMQWSSLAFRREWTNEELGRFIIIAGKLIHENQTE
tara:strand:- start:40 stop:219 length:180 start_codon:yes stop_codon:yes gene_type:complete